MNTKRLVLICLAALFAAAAVLMAAKEIFGPGLRSSGAVTAVFLALMMAILAARAGTKTPQAK